MVDVLRNDLESAPGQGEPRASSVTTELQAAILGWYDEHGRSLRFRSTRDPYAVLVLEVMAQQTQISRVDAAWTAFLATFPTIAVLADATPADVLRAWRGLGYNRRALNLWRAARLVVEEHGGELPQDVAALERLPGVGPYTARAVAAIAFGLPVGAVDTNVRRVLARTLRGSRDAFTPAEIQRAADASVPRDRPADWTHALMDVGTAHCRSTAPTCGPCPARRHCRYAATDGAEEQPRSAVAARAVQFPATSRWLRGRILDRLRDGGGWVVLDDAIGQHDRAAIEAALRDMAAEGLLQRDADRALQARLPIANGAAAG